MKKKKLWSVTRQKNRLYKTQHAISDYSLFNEIDGEHSLKEGVSDFCVEYKARKRKNGKVLFFNFDLAREMGLIPADHPNKLNRSLKSAILDSFGIVIINEYDEIHKTPIEKRDIRAKTYMATRYLQLQHPDKKGKNSGDGRSIWNGEIRLQGKTWDITSCGTGATCLSPATSQYKKFFQTGDPEVSYGCGYAEAVDGLGAAMMSEIFHKNHVATERTLAIIEFAGNFSINIRAGQNLIRPSHFFRYLKQSNWQGGKELFEHYYQRQVQNGLWPNHKDAPDRLQHFMHAMVENFAHIAAKFERDYIFCWLDWDGDNILADGGIIDYGSVRQFGLFHHEYRYRDVDRFSTNIIEQKNKAKYTVQTFIQYIDFVRTKKKKNLSDFAHHPLLEQFEETFQFTLKRLLLEKLGFNDKHIDYLMQQHVANVTAFENVYSYFERAKSSKGPKDLPDGITHDAVYCMRDLLREMPQRYLKDFYPIPHEDFLDILASKFVDKQALELKPVRTKKIDLLQNLYMDFITILEREFKVKRNRILLEMSMRSSVINRYERITGDAIIRISDDIYNRRKQLKSDDFYKLIDEFIQQQILVPTKKIAHKDLKNNQKMEGSGGAGGTGSAGVGAGTAAASMSAASTSAFSSGSLTKGQTSGRNVNKKQKIFRKMLNIVKKYRDGL